MNRIKKNSTIKQRNIIKQNNKMKKKKRNLPLNNKTNESVLIKSLKSMIKSYVKKIVTEICIAGILALPSHMTDARTIRTIKFNAEINMSYSSQDQNGIGQPSPISSY